MLAGALAAGCRAKGNGYTDTARSHYLPPLKFPGSWKCLRLQDDVDEMRGSFRRLSLRLAGPRHFKRDISTSRLRRP